MGVWCCETDGFSDSGVLQQSRIDFERRDFFSASVDEFFEASGKG